MPPDLQHLRDASDRALKAYRENHNESRAPHLEETLDRRRWDYMIKYVEWVGGDPWEKDKMKSLITAIEGHWGWGNKEGAETKG